MPSGLLQETGRALDGVSVQHIIGSPEHPGPTAASLLAAGKSAVESLRILGGNGNEATTTLPGCFRCHDGNHQTKAGLVLSQDCNSCHSLLAMGEENPKILQEP